jgi:hypothetical protein
MPAADTPANRLPDVLHNQPGWVIVFIMVNVLIAGKEFPGGVLFARTAQDFQRNILLTSEQEDSQGSKQKVRTVGWNKSSPISTRSVVIGAENLYTKIDEAVLFFDAGWYAGRYPVFSTKDSSRALDDMIAGYLHMTLELLARYSKKGFGRIIYLFKEGISADDTPKSVTLPGEKKAVPTGILSLTAQAAFRAFAESIATSYTAAEYTQIVLIHAGYAQTDDEIARKLFPYLDSEQSREQKKNARTSPQWIKYGIKTSPGFGLFKRR